MERPSQHLEFYECMLDDKIAFITADLNLHDSAPQKDRPIVARFTIPLLHPRDNGLPTSEERPRIRDIEDKLEDLLWERLQAVLAGKFFSDGVRKLYFYMASADVIEEAVGSITQEFVPYNIDWATWEDAAWECYLEMLYPNPLGFQYIQDRHTLEALKSEGDPLTEPREVFHWIYFQDEETASEYLKAREAEGFKRITLTKSDMDDGRPWMLEISRTDKVDMGSVTELTQHLWIAADKVGGEYDGWECQVQEGPA